MLCQLVYRH